MTGQQILHCPGAAIGLNAALYIYIYYIILRDDYFYGQFTQSLILNHHFIIYYLKIRLTGSSKIGHDS